MTKQDYIDYPRMRVSKEIKAQVLNYFYRKKIDGLQDSLRALTDKLLLEALKRRK